MFDTSLFFLLSGVVLIFGIRYLINGHTIKKLSNELGVSERRIRSKIKKGWNIEDIQRYYGNRFDYLKGGQNERTE